MPSISLEAVVQHFSQTAPIKRKLELLGSWKLELGELGGRLARLMNRLHSDSDLTAEARADIGAELTDIQDRQREICEYLESGDDGEVEEDEEDL